MKMTMSGWKLIDEDTARDHWDSWLSLLGDDCLYQTYGWGAHKALIGQAQTRIGFFSSSDSPNLVMQCHLKKLPFGIFVLWIPGGPIGELDVLTNEALNEIKRLLGAKHLLIRASIMRERNGRDVSTLRRFGHREAKIKVNSGLSMWLPIPEASAEVLASASSNWRHNLRRGQKRATAERLLKPDPKEIANTYRTLQETKGLGEQFSESTISAMIQQFGDNLVVFGSRDQTGKLIAMRACICAGKTGWDIWAAATEDARKNYTSHLLLDSLLKECQKKGFNRYELSGIDPQKAQGVYNFKKGTGAHHIEYLGEWDFGSRWLSVLLVSIIKLKEILG